MISLIQIKQRYLKTFITIFGLIIIVLAIGLIPNNKSPRVVTFDEYLRTAERIMERSATIAEKVELKAQFDANAEDASKRGMIFVDGETEIKNKLSKLNENFICPEDYPSLDEHFAELSVYVSEAKKIYPELTEMELIELRDEELVKHNCQETLDNMARYDERETNE